MKSSTLRLRHLLPVLALAVLALAMGLSAGRSTNPAEANPHTGQSLNVAIIGSPGCIRGGALPTTGPAGELGDFVFTNLHPAAVNAVSLAAFDTAALNVCSVEMGCNTGTLTAASKSALVSFVSGGGKLIIYDSECSSQDYSWLPFPFTTNNPGPRGGRGTLTIVEDNILSHRSSADPHFINAAALGSNTDAVGDMNVMTTRDANWCLDMSGTNSLNQTGPVHTYARQGAIGTPGLYLYNGLDIDFMGFEPTPPAPNGLRKIWLQELQVPLNPSRTELPCGVTVVGITLEPPSATNPVGTQHTVTATVKDNLGAPQQGVTVTFTVTSGPNAGASGTCNPPSCKTDANGQVSFTYTGTGGPGQDKIKACFTNSANQVVCSQEVTKDWTQPQPAVVTLDPPAATNTVGTQHCVTATVTDASGNPVPNVTVVFSVSGAHSASGSAITDANGQAVFCYTGTVVGPDTISAFADCCPTDGTQQTNEPSGTATKTWVAGDPARLTLDPKTATNPVDTQHCVTATVTDAFGNPTPGITVRFSVTGSSPASGSATTDANGEATFCYVGPPLPGADAIHAYADTNNDNTQDPGEPLDDATKTWVLPVSTPLCEVKITQGGWIIDVTGDRASFGGNAKADGQGNASGNEEYQNHGPSLPFNLHGNVLVVVCNSPTSATIFGEATVDGSGSHTYRIDVQDLGEPGNQPKGKDTYRMRFNTPFIYDSVEQPLKGGNVQIHKSQ